MYCPTIFGTANVLAGDCRLASTYAELGLRDGAVDAVVTSPPYATALPYIDTDRLSILLVLGMRRRDRTIVERQLIGSREITTADRVALENCIEASDFSSIRSASAVTTIRDVYRLNRRGDVGFRRRNQAALLYRYYRDMSEAMSRLSRVMRPGGALCFVMGDTVTTAGGGRVVIPSTRVVREIGETLGWTCRNRLSITVTQEARPHHRNSITQNEIIWMQK
jgi:tRNA G10  N-methylase Trm11